MNRPETRRKPPLRPILVAVGLALSAGPVAPRAVAAAPATAKGNQLDLKQFGAVGDGRRDDRPALSRALAALKAAGGGTLYVPDGTYKVVATAHDAYLSVPPNVTIRGRKGFSRVVLSSDDPKGYRELLRIDGDGVALEGLHLSRKGAVTGIFVKIFPGSGFLMSSVTIDGNDDDHPGGVHATEIASVAKGQYSDVRFEGCTVTGVDYGLFMTNESTATLKGFVATGCLFVRNRSDDLQFNAPSGEMTDITVSDCTFRENLNTDPSSGAGFGIGLAHVQGASLRDCRFENYDCEAIHIEDRSREVLISGCRFTRRGGSGYAVVNVLNDSHDITIANNFFDASAAGKPFPCVLVTTGGSRFPTSGDVTVTGNSFRLGGRYNGIEAFSAPRMIVANNRFEGAGSVKKGKYSGGQNFGVNVTNSRWAVVTGNIFWGLGSPIGGSASFPPAQSSVVSGNVVIQCDHDLAGAVGASGEEGRNVIDKDPR